TFYVHNRGGGPTTMLAVSNLGPPFGISQNTCGAVLQPGTYCSFLVTFTPSGGGQSNAQLVVTWADTSGPGPDAVMQLVGQATNRAQLSINDCSNCGGGGPNPPPVDFGVSGTPVTRTVWLYNSGGDGAQITALGGLTAPFTIGNDQCTGKTVPQNG